MPQLTKAFTWSGEDVYLGPDHKFLVAATENQYATASEAKDAIDRHLAALARVKKKKLNLAVYTNHGEATVITGLHASRGTPLTSPKIEQWDREFYPDCSMVRETITRLKEAEDLCESLHSRLSDWKIEFDGYHFRDEDIDARYSRVEKTYQENLKDALEVS